MVSASPEPARLCKDIAVALTFRVQRPGFLQRVVNLLFFLRQAVFRRRKARSRFTLHVVDCQRFPRLFYRLRNRKFLLDTLRHVVYSWPDGGCVRVSGLPRLFYWINIIQNLFTVYGCGNMKCRFPYGVFSILNIGFPFSPIVFPIVIEPAMRIPCSALFHVSRCGDQLLSGLYLPLVSTILENCSFASRSSGYASNSASWLMRSSSRCPSASAFDVCLTSFSFLRILVTEPDADVLSLIPCLDAAAVCIRFFYACRFYVHNVIQQRFISLCRCYDNIWVPSRVMRKNSFASSG